MCVLNTAYFPPVAWFAALWHCKKARLEACENFQKGSFRNRCHIATANGVQRLSVPLEKGKHQQTPIRAVRLSYATPWPLLHWRAIQTAYGNAPFFEFYADEIAALLEKRHNFLFDLNQEIIVWLCHKFGITGDFSETEQFLAAGTAETGDFRITAIQTPELPQWYNPAAYAQVFGDRQPFQPNLSALDLLCCRGNTAGEILSESFVLK